MVFVSLLKNTYRPNQSGKKNIAKKKTAKPLEYKQQ
jgi:hypothetical protein